ncbi:MAG: DUF4340 domain-containing protein [Planctomycetes bacterium]|nr:DUF4340 domain-containing protein [Planctomycetota bacterium]
MNFRTTLFLAVVLAALALIYVWRPRTDSAAATTDKATLVETGSPAARDVIEPKLGEVEKIACKLKSGVAMAFEKRADGAGSMPSAATPQKVWFMTSPRDMKVLTWEVDRITRQLTGLKYEIVHRPGEAGAVTAAQAGLEPPEVVVTLTDADGKSAVVEVGRAASANETFVRLSGKPDIFVGTTSLRNLVRPRPLEYRDQQLWTFAADKAQRVEIVDRSSAQPVSYVFARDGGKWVMEQPVSAKATAKVDELVQAMCRLRVMKWEDDRPDRLAAYGLESPLLTIRTTVEEQVPKPKAEDAAAKEEAQDAATGDADKPAEMETRVSVYELHVAALGPVGEDTKAFVKTGTGADVGTVMKTTTDKFKPVMAEWREMRVTTTNVTAATRIEMTDASGTSALTKRDGAWWFEGGDAARAEQAAVSSLLTAVQGLTAVTFVDGGAVEPAATDGFAKPIADLRLTIPGVEGGERITVGGFTDSATKRLVYVRRGETGSIAKVKAADVAALLQGPRALRDRTIFQIPNPQVDRLTLSRDNRLAEGRTEFVFTRDGGQWSLTSPVSAAIRPEPLTKLLDALCSLSAVAIVSDQGEASAYGLHAPAAAVQIRYAKSDPAAAPAPAEDGTAPGAPGAAEAGKGEEGPAGHGALAGGSATTLELLVTEHDGKHYAKRADRNTIFEVTPEFYNSLFEEFRTDGIVTFDEKQVREFSVRSGEQRHVFRRSGARWVYDAEPDLPLDAKKVENLLLQLKDLKTERYVAYGPSEAGGFGLAAPQHEATITLDDGTSLSLRVSAMTCTKDPAKGVFAAVAGRNEVFLLSPEAAARFNVSLDEIEAKK